MAKTTCRCKACVLYTSINLEEQNTSVLLPLSLTKLLKSFCFQYLWGAADKQGSVTTAKMEAHG